MATKFAERFPAGSVIVLMARNAKGLDQTKSAAEVNNPAVRVRTVPVDLGGVDEDTLRQYLGKVVKELGVSVGDFEQACIVHNAATLGDVSKNVTQHVSTTDIRKYWDVNLTSVVALNSVFLDLFPQDEVQQRVVINISSICAIQPFRSWSLYCAGKAARNMLFRTMALEEPSIRILNYSPGPIDTHMQLQARTETADPELKTLFKDMHENGRLLSSEESISKLTSLLEKNSFDNGAHIDYYDI